MLTEMYGNIFYLGNNCFYITTEVPSDEKACSWWRSYIFDLRDLFYSHFLKHLLSVEGSFSLFLVFLRFETKLLNSVYTSWDMLPPASEERCFLTTGG